MKLKAQWFMELTQAAKALKGLKSLQAVRKWKRLSDRADVTCFLQSDPWQRPLTVGENLSGFTCGFC
jgi:hypothetical protein